MIKRLTQASSTIASAAILVGVFSLLSRVMGFLRDRFLAASFSGAELDAYFQAFRVPDLIFQLFVSGALSASFIPIFAKYWQAGQEDQAWRYTNRIGLLLFGGLGLVVLLVLMQGRLLVEWLAPGFSVEGQEMVRQLLPAILVAQMIFAGSFLAGSALQATKRFFLTSLAPVFYNLGILVGVWLFQPSFGVLSLGVGVVLGALAHGAVQLVGILALGYGPRFTLPFGDSDVWQTLKQAGPRLLGLAVSQVGFMGMMTAATYFAVGTVRNLTFAYNVNMLPVGIVAVSYAVAAFPTFSAAAAKGEHKVAEDALSLALRQVLFFLIPATALMLMLRAQLIRVAYGVEGFTWADTVLTAEYLAYFGVSLSAQGLVYILVRYLHAYGHIRGPVLAGLVTLAVQAGVTWWLMPIVGSSALPIGFSVAALVQVAVLFVLVYRQAHSFPTARLLHSLATLSSAGFFAAAAAQLVKTVYGNWWPLESFWGVASQVLLAAGTGILVYGLICAWLKSTELFAFAAGFRAKFLRSALPAELPDSTNGS
jgi:putative peptidoglycan lipid II flippase